MKAPPLKVSQTCVQPSTCYCWAVVVWEEENEPNWNEWKHHCLECLSRFFPEYRMPLQTHTHTHTPTRSQFAFINQICLQLFHKLSLFLICLKQSRENTCLSRLVSANVVCNKKRGTFRESEFHSPGLHNETHTHTHSLPCQGICECGIFVENLLNLNIAIAVCRWARTGGLDMKGKHWFLFYEHCTFKRWNELLFALSWNCACSDAVLFRTKWD